jgi:hypothetical protein
VLDFPILEVTRMKPVFVVAVSLAFVVGAFACPGVTLVGGGTLCPDGGSEVCDDGIFCTGVERCVAGTCQREPVRCDDGIACSVDRCDRALDRCVSSAPDVDQDGFGDSACLDGRGQPLGEDCNDSNANVAPGNLEVCDDAGLDEDCNRDTFGTRDVDSDLYIDVACFQRAPDGGRLSGGADCDDSQVFVNPGIPEFCNRRDDNCNGIIDETVTSLRYTDADRDGFGAGAPITGCDLPGTSDVGGDCDDSNPAMLPGQFRCIPGGQGFEFQFCAVDGGGFLPGRCMTSCRPQPNGTGICL